jgi:ATP-dependent DNA helicase RecG
MVIQHAERFGLSQLHQLRGRVGRGVSQSYCILIAPDWMRKNIGATFPRKIDDDDDREKMKSVRRLQTMVQTTDGFKIAEIDLELRGPGDFFSTRQSGLPRLRIANLITDGEILSTARKEAFKIVDDDPQLRESGNQALKRYYEEWMKEDLSLLQGG